jgi:hypothetical protein
MSGNSLGTLEPVPLKQFWPDEAKDFTPWLAKEESLELLSATLGMELELEGIEMFVGPYKADIVAHDATSDTRVIIENQLDKTNHDHLGKVITYASGLNAKVIIWIAKEFTEEHRRAIDFLNEVAAPDLLCFGVEMQLWKIGASQPAPMFRAVARPNEYTSSVKIESEDKLTEAKALYLDFWTHFKDFCKSKGTALSIRTPRPQHWFHIAVGRSQFSLSLTASIQKKRLGCEIYMRGVNAKKAFKLLQKDKMDIETATGPLDWQELPEGQDCRIVLYRLDMDISAKSNWEEAFAWLKSEAETFHKAFSNRIKALPILDAATEDEDHEFAEALNGQS